MVVFLSLSPALIIPFHSLFIQQLVSDLHTSNFGITRDFIERELKLIFACFEMTGQIKVCIRKDL